MSGYRQILWTILIVLVACLGTAAANVVYTNRVDQRRAESARVAEAAQREQALKAKASFCALVLSQVQVYVETPPATEAGKNARDNWIALATQFDC